MDIDLLSKMVKELILDNDEVSLPGVGSFVAELVPSSFSDKGYTINPPYKRLSFRKKADASDNVLIDFYAKSNNVDKETASKIVIDFLSEMQKVLELRKSIVFPGLGKLRATKENIFFFVADEDLDIYPEGFGLEPISLKTHEETPAEVSATIAALQDILNPEETESQSGSGEQPEAESGSEEPSEAVSGPEDAPEVTGGGQLESSLEAENESDSELQPEQQATAEEPDHQSENESQHDEESEQETAQHGEASSSDDAPEVTGDGQSESSLEAENESDSELQPEQQATAEEPDHQSENESQHEPEAASQLENEPQQTTAEESDPQPEQMEEPKDSNNVEEVSATDVTEQPRTEPAKKSRKGWKALIWTAVAIAALAVTFIVGFVILAHIAPDFIDSILYTQEELEIINH
jgi:nucleoid DNA-binding protein